MLSYIWPVALAVLGNTFYNIITKSTPSDANAFLSLTVTYVVASVCSFALYLVQKTNSISFELSKLNWSSYALGICVLAIEFGYIYLYRAGWKVNTGSIVANLSLACVLVFVGYFVYKENISLTQLIGMLLCAGGLILVTK